MIPTSLILISVILQYKSIHEELCHHLQEIQRRPVLKWPPGIFGIALLLHQLMMKIMSLLQRLQQIYILDRHKRAPVQNNIHESSHTEAPIT